MYDHLTRIVERVLETQPPDTVDIVEDLSRQLKYERLSTIFYLDITRATCYKIVTSHTQIVVDLICVNKVFRSLFGEARARPKDRR